MNNFEPYGVFSNFQVEDDFKPYMNESLELTLDPSNVEPEYFSYEYDEDENGQ